MITCDFASAIARLPRRATLFIPGGAGYPTLLVEELMHQVERFESLTIIHEHVGNPVPFLDPSHAGRIKVIALLVTGRPAEAYRLGMLHYTPIHFSLAAEAFLKGLLPTPDAALVQVAPKKDRLGWNLGLYVGMIPAAAAASRLVIAEINESMPALPGGSGAALANVDLACETDHPLVAVEARLPSPADEQIAQSVAELVHDGDTIQLGLGSLADAIARRLSSRRDLGFHSGMFTDGLVDLVKSGALSNRHKGLDPGRSAAAISLGSSALYAFLREYKEVIMYPYSYTHDQANIRQQPGFVAINSALEVDLTGQVNAEWMKGVPAGGVGGQVDFLRSSRASKGGRGIIALRSTAGANLSRIVANFAVGTPVTTARTDLDFVITEYGTADLRAKNLQQRAEALIGIAHPDLRAQLAATANNK